MTESFDRKRILSDYEMDLRSGESDEMASIASLLTSVDVTFVNCSNSRADDESVA